MTVEPDEKIIKANNMFCCKFERCVENEVMLDLTDCSLGGERKAEKDEINW